MTSKMINEDVYQQTLAESVHFSVKTINSNIEKGGIRLTKDQKLDLPYISARTLLADDFLIPTDYQANAGKTATYFKVIKAAQLDEDLSEADDEFKQNVGALKPYLNDTFSELYSSGLEHIDVRMRQLLIPKNDGYISISPISAAGVNHYLNIEVDTLKEQRKNEGKDSKLKNIQTAVFGIGGANPQNVGSLVRSMQRPIVLGSPTLNHQARLAFQYFYKGFDYKLSNAFINRDMYVELTIYARRLERQSSLTHNIGLHEQGVYAPFSNLKEREKEFSTIEKAVANVLAQGSEILEILKSIKEQLPSQKVLERKSFWSHPDVKILTQGLINPELQQFDDWKELFAEHLAKKITQHSYWQKEVEIQKKWAAQTDQKIDILIDEENSKGFLKRRILELLK
nr:hypothetical protein [Acinetobacter sp. Marseille-Q1620]